MADVNTQDGGVFDINATPRLFNIQVRRPERRGSLTNRTATAVTIYFFWNMTVAQVALLAKDDSEQINKDWLTMDESLRIPMSCNSFVAVTASGNAKLRHLED